jgi:DNA-binding HxlR family transcriptional regulator
VKDGTSESLGYSGDTCCEVDGSDDGYDVKQWDVREGCEVRQILDRVADKWSLLVIALLDCQSLRFSELRRAINGVSQRMLSRTLRHLERDGLVSRTVHASVPPRVEYELTPMGRTLHGTIRTLVTWTEEHQLQIAAARAAYDVRVAAEAEAASAEAARRDMVAREVLDSLR